MSLTNFGENLLLDLSVGIIGAAPVTLFFGLSTTDPGETGVMTGEPTAAGGYARVSRTNNAANFPAAAGGVKGNGTLATFPVSSAAWSTGPTALGFWFLTDSGTLGAGNMIAKGALTTPRAVNASGITLEAAINGFTLTAD